MANRTIVCPQCKARLGVPSGATRLRCRKCQDVFAVPPAPAADPNASKRAAAAAGVCVLVAIGFVMSIQPVTLMTGSMMIWVGVALVAGGTALAFFLGAPVWVRILAPIVLALALVNVLVVEDQMSDRRDQISRTLDR